MSDFSFKQFTISQNRCAQKVSTDACIFGAWVTEKMDLPTRVLDIGAGTGLLMLMIAQKSNAIIDGIEIDDHSFEELQENLRKAEFSSRVFAVKGDARNFLFPHEYDLIISNPPFYENQLLSENAHKNIAWHSSMLKLEELFTVVKKNLSSTGKFAIIIPFARIEETIEFASNIGLHANQQALIRHSLHHE
ncbi:MAG: tRNA1(Val) (adenine(37)-N6)-methyltransferase, partial [Sphingobacteriales bacterium]